MLPPAMGNVQEFDSMTSGLHTDTLGYDPEFWKMLEELTVLTGQDGGLTIGTDCSRSKYYEHVLT